MPGLDLADLDPLARQVEGKGRVSPDRVGGEVEEVEVVPSDEAPGLPVQVGRAIARLDDLAGVGLDANQLAVEDPSLARARERPQRDARLGGLHVGVERLAPDTAHLHRKREPTSRVAEVERGDLTPGRLTAVSIERQPQELVAHTGSLSSDRQRYREASDRWGRQGSPSFSISSAAGVLGSS